MRQIVVTEKYSKDELVEQMSDGKQNIERGQRREDMRDNDNNLIYIY